MVSECSECDNDASRCFCEQCLSSLRNSDERPPWSKRYTEEQHERAVSLLSEQDEIECVISDYTEGKIVVHTPYVSSEVVTDFCNHFGFQIVAFNPQWDVDGVWPCISEHGSIFEIVLQYRPESPMPLPMKSDFRRNYIDNLDGNDKQFE